MFLKFGVILSGRMRRMLQGVKREKPLLTSERLRPGVIGVVVFLD